MNVNVTFFLSRLLKETRGQMLYIAAAGFTAVIGMGGLATDLGHGYFAFQKLKASTNAAALAGAEAMPDTNTATSNIVAYSVATGEQNASALLSDASAKPTFLCLTTLTNMGIPCVTSTGTTSGSYNAVRVVQTAKVPLWFGRMFGVSDFSLTAVSTAAISGGSNTPWNIAIVLDTTDSMSSKDSGLQCSGTQISCALLGVQALLEDLYPCAMGTTCSALKTNPLMVSGAVDSVSLFVFPPVTTATETKDYVCNTSNPTTAPYTFSDVTAGSSQNLNLPAADTYQVIQWSSNYRASDATTTLNQSSEIAIAAGDSGISKCAGISAPGGEGTYYAQSIYAAQAALIAEQTANPGSRNAMIILSDGNATACNTSTSTGNDCKSGGSSQIVASSGTLNGTGTKSSNPNGYESYTYPSALGECGQAVVAANAATTAGTRVYTVGYGSETTGCTTDTKYSAYPGISPCTTMKDMATSAADFFSDDADGCASTNGVSYTKLTQIFQAIAGSLTNPRLIPNGTT